MKLSKCVTWNSTVHHLFIPNCRDQFFIENRNVNLQINSIGLRERPAEQLKKNQLLFVGDSSIEGVGLNFEETFPQIFEKALFNESNIQFINMGIRRSSTITQLVRLKEYIDIIQPKYLLWSLTENDFDEDFIFLKTALDFNENGNPIKFDLNFFSYSNPQIFDSLFFGLDAYNNGYSAIFRHLYINNKLSKHLVGNDRLPAYCNALDEGIQLAKERNIKIQFIILPFGPDYYSIYEQGSLKEKLNKIVGCLASTPIDLRLDSIQTKSDFFQEDLMHFNAKGIEESLKYIKPDLLSFLTE
ncbi:MAG: SGNH/GDSL hydrolase family protein [Bdellovibrionaceae bacterium]|nr:SGNH/GDSL hydrolase family protein [Pseudobdellovibrionaceae bacterium]